MTTRDPADGGRGLPGQVEQVRDELRRQVVDDVPADVLEHAGRRRPPRPGHPRDHEQLQRARLLVRVLLFGRRPADLLR
jgi:hypothetical protein